MKVHLIHKIVAGSRLYGTATEQSDTDYRGVVLQPAKTILGLGNFEQAERGGDTDLVYYGVSKFFKLALNANPNILDILFAPPSTWLVESDIWYKIYAMRGDFLSQRVRRTFLGYASSQLKRIRTHLRWMDDQPHMQPVPDDFGLLRVGVAKGALRYALKEVPFNEVAITKAGQAAITETYGGVPDMDALRGHIMNLVKSSRYEQELQRRVKAYEAALRERKQYLTWLKNRNPARHKLEREYGYDTKHAAHLFRLLIKAQDILRYGDYNPRLSPAQLVVVKAVLTGQLSYESMILRQEKMAEFIKGIDSPLPEEPDIEAVEQQLMEINMMTVGLLGWAGEEIPAELATVEEV